MTTIAAKKTPSGKVQIAWDAQTTSGNTGTKHSIKVRKINNQFAVGVAGHVRFSNLVHSASVDRIHPADIVDPSFDAHEWTVNCLVPAWGKAVQKGMEQVPMDDMESPWGHALVILAGHIFKIGADYSVVDQGDFGAIGSGSHFAIAAMHLGKNAIKAVTVASELDLYTGGDVKEMTL